MELKKPFMSSLPVVRLMHTVQISQDYTITLPNEVVQRMNLKSGDQLEFEVIDEYRAIFKKVE